MGCNTSKLDDVEAVRICKDRKKFIKQALEHRTKFALGHIAYLQSLKRVSAALREYIEGDESREFLSDSFITPPFTPVTKSKPKFITISPKCISAPTIQSKENFNVKINYYRPSGTESFSVEERPQSPDTYRVQSYSPTHQYGFDGFFAMQTPQTNSPYGSHSYYSQYNVPDIPPPSPSPSNPSRWDFFWNPFSSLDYYGYPARTSPDQTIIDDDIVSLRQVREEEGIPDLEEETDNEEVDESRHRKEETTKRDSNVVREEVTVEDIDEEEQEDDDETESEDENEHEHEAIASSQAPDAGKIEVNRHETMVSERQKKEEEAPGFTAYVNRRPTSMNEVIKDLESQFMIVCGAASEVSAMLEANQSDCLPASSEVTGVKTLNPAALIRSASSRSSSSRFLVNSSVGSRDEGSESSSHLSDESYMFSGSHHSTLDRLYAWEKRLYEEVRSGERVRLAYEKKSTKLKNQASKGDEPSQLEKTRTALRALHTQIKVSIHSIEAISKRIETLRDEELLPQLLELIQGLSRMWKVMAECHQTQKHTLDEAKLLLAGTPSKLNRSNRYHPTLSSTELARSAQILQSELRNWRSCFASWIASQRSYVLALCSWLLRCMRREANTSELPFSPRRSPGVHPMFGIFIQWTRLLDAVSETKVLDGMDFFAAGMGSIYTQSQTQSQTQAQVQVQSQSQNIGGSQRFEDSGGSMDMVEVGKVEESMTLEKISEVAVRVLCAGMSVATSSLAEFADSSAEGYAELVKQWGNVKWPPNANAEGM
ncbi:unnamed protein product [Amaranthus hypochondriacus]